LEPLLGPVDLTRWLPSLDWVIAGGESGPNARPMHPDWVRSIRDQCLAAGVPFLFKQWGQWRYAVEVDEVEAEQALKASGQPDPFARTPCYTVGLDGSYSNTEPPRPGNATMMRVGKKRAGRLLDGRTWDQFPQANRDVPGVSGLVGAGHAEHQQTPINPSSADRRPGNGQQGQGEGRCI
jgi:hypothetical protein